MSPSRAVPQNSPRGVEVVRGVWDYGNWLGERARARAVVHLRQATQGSGAAMRISTGVGGGSVQYLPNGKKQQRIRFSNTPCPASGQWGSGNVLPSLPHCSALQLAASDNGTASCPRQTKHAGNGS
ncbi:hypothetical protein F5144DRAFT_551748 [Chaetomium tenue]|uniref:Uncharacterized protein n=1 Tax=Chaetomium tenue TaxID=1854479 RepID=A0ACB7NXU0_9PEZI|nr:hypothetical protein F5144DRAFT_551748 [Chaetomium globosum]